MNLSIFFNLTYGLPIQLSKRDYLTGNVTIINFKLKNGIIVFLDRDIKRERYEVISKISNSYEIFDDSSLYNKRIEFQWSGYVLWNDHKFLGDYFHNLLGQFDNMGLFNLWKTQQSRSVLSVRKLEREWNIELKHFGITKGLLQETLNWKKLVDIFKLFLIVFTVTIIINLIEKLFYILTNNKISNDIRK